MARKCTVCKHTQVRDIEKSLIQGIGLRKIAEQFSLSTTALHRHKKHLNETLIKASEAKDIIQADNLMEQISSLQARALTILTKTEEAEDWRGANGAVREVRGCLELLGKLAGELRYGHTINLVLTPQWLEIRTSILQALEAHPEAKISVLKALEEKIYE